MILILGSTHDDILYYESVMTNRKDETIFGFVKVEYGSIFNQEVALVYDLYTSYISSLVTNYIIQQYFVVLIFVVGKCVAYSEDTRPGDIVISRRVILGDVDQVKEANVKLGQLPHLPRSLESQDEVIGYISSALEKRSFSRYEIATYISANGILDKTNKIAPLVMNEYVLGHKSKVVFDCTSGGAFLAAQIHSIPAIAVKVVEYHVDAPTNANTYINALKQYSVVGRAIVTCIGDIGRNDIIRE